jgi:hypothetical protein
VVCCFPLQGDGMGGDRIVRLIAFAWVCLQFVVGILGG